METSFNVQGQTVFLNVVPTTCPYCYYTIVPVEAYNAFRVANSSTIDVVYRCANRKCTKPFIAVYEKSKSVQGAINPHNNRYLYDKILRPEDDNVSIFPEEISGLSKEFPIIYNQAEVAENKKLDRIAGMGYRKSLEFLIKDYLIKKKPTEEENIKKTLLGPCIKQIDDKRIKDIAERATWLGNDETHYVKRWIDKDIVNLKVLIKLVVNYISDELLYEETMRSMPAPTKH